MKNKKILFLIFILFMIVFPYFNKNYVFADKDDLGSIFSKALAGFFVLIFQVIHSILWFLNWLLSVIVDIISNLDPFKEVNNQDPPVKTIWSVLVYFSYIIIVFSALLAAYEWLFGNDVSAKRLIFNLIIVALIINFTYVLAEAAFEIVKKIEDGLFDKSIQDISNPNKKIGVGTFILNSLWQFDLYGELAKLFPSEKKSNNTSNNTFNWKELANRLFYFFIGATVSFLLSPLSSFAFLGATGSIMLDLFNIDHNQWLGKIFTSIFIVVIDMVIFIILFVLVVLYVMRYIIIIFLVGVSSIAVASLAFPRFEKIKALENIASRFNLFDPWLNEFVKWLLVIPIFVILVILGNTLKANTLGQISLDQTNQSLNTIIQFVLVLALLSGWYIMSLVVANQLSGRVGHFASAAATGFLVGIGGLAAAGIGFGAMRFFAPTISKMGKFLENTGDKLVSMGGPGFLGNITYKLGTTVQKIGKQYSELPYKGDIEAIKAAFQSLIVRKAKLEEELERETDEKKRQEKLKEKNEITKRLGVLITDAEKRGLLPYLSEDIKNLDDNKSLIALHKDPKILSKLYGNDKTKNAILNRVKQLNDRGLAEVLETISEFSDKDYKDLKNQVINSILESTNIGKKSLGKIKEIIKNPEKMEDLVDKLSEDAKDNLIENISKFGFEDVKNILTNLIQGQYKKSSDILKKALISNIEKNFNEENVVQLISNFNKNTFNQIPNDIKEALDKTSKGLITNLLQNSLIGFASLSKSFLQNSRNYQYFANIYKNFGFNEYHLQDLLTIADNKLVQRFIVNSLKYNKIPIDFNKLDRSKLSPEISALISSNLSTEKLNRSEKNTDILFEQIIKQVEEKVKKTSLQEQQEISQQPKKIEIDIT